MDYLTFGEQVKIILGRRGMTIKELAERVEAFTGKPMSRQNMTQRLGRDNFQEQDMRLIAEILGCNFQLNILEGTSEKEEPQIKEEEASVVVEEEVKEVTVGDLIEEPAPQKTSLFQGFRGMKKGKIVSKEEALKEEVEGDINPYTGKEYQTNSVRTHPTRIGYVQVYDREDHKWTEMTEWAFLGYQERKKALMGKDYEPPVYLD